MFTCRVLIHKMQGTDSHFPRRIEDYITAMKFKPLSSLRWSNLFRRKCMKLDILHVSIPSSFPFVWCAPGSCTVIPIRARICDRRHLNIVNYLNRNFSWGSFIHHHVTGMSKRSIETVFRTNSKRSYCYVIRNFFGTII